MCGIIGYIGPRDVASVLMGGLWRLEYRGYDSCGLALIDNDELSIRKVPGKLSELAELLKKEPVKGRVGLGHTRWATHGLPQEKNTHPLIDCPEEIAIVVNGIIENYLTLKEDLENRGHIFRSLTDSEVIVHLIEDHIGKGLYEAVRRILPMLRGSYAFGAISVSEPDKIVCARHDAPLICSVGPEESALASDFSGVLSIFNNVIDLPNGSIGILTAGNCRITDHDGNNLDVKSRQISLKVKDINKGNYPHFMLKEIYEQPQIIQNIIKDRVQGEVINLGSEVNLNETEMKNISRILIQACGTSWHAGVVGKYLIEKFARISTEVDISSEFRYRDTVLDGDTAVMAISQSGETADTLAGLREAKTKFLKVLSLVNVPHSSIYRESDSNVAIMAGPEIGVASTKAYTAEIVNLYLISLYLGKLRGFVNAKELSAHIDALRELPYQVEEILNNAGAIREIAEKFANARDFLFLGRGINYPTALEGALKLKEISYIHSTGYAAGEMKHGPIALIDANMPVVCINPQSSVYDKMLNNIQEVYARQGIILSLVSDKDVKTRAVSRYSITIPICSEYTSAILAVVPLQLLAYYIATNKGLDVDRPRNLAKSVTVE